MFRWMLKWEWGKIGWKLIKKYSVGSRSEQELKAVNFVKLNLFQLFYLKIILFKATKTTFMHLFKNHL
jgi:hypothetical protein